MNRPTIDRTVAAVVTAVFHVVVALILLSAYLRYVDDSATRRWPPVDKSELLVVEDDGQFVKMGDIPEASASSADEAQPAESEVSEPSPALDLRNEGQKATPPEPVVSERQSPMKVEKKEKPKEDKKGPTAEELAEKQRIKEQQETREKIASTVKFNNSGSGSGSGTAGSPNGNASHGASSGTPGHNLSGRSFISAGKPSSTKTGEIRINIAVNSEGHVTRATYASGSGPAASDASVRESCRRAALQSRFTALAGAAEQTGTITWRFK
ncbi:MAG: energy transducer TonB [Muribaculaceae bacterium]|nr:energy transducer TonB [Muribaculaceae bacterium]